jgi:hypothetical protein
MEFVVEVYYEYVPALRTRPTPAIDKINAEITELKEWKKII